MVEVPEGRASEGGSIIDFSNVVLPKVTDGKELKLQC